MFIASEWKNSKIKKTEDLQTNQSFSIGLIVTLHQNQDISLSFF